MAIKDWKPAHRHSYGIIWNKHSDFSKPQYRDMKNPTAFIYLYNKGHFRDMEDKWVVSTSLTGGSNPLDRMDKGFKTKSQALNYAKSYIRSH